MKTIYDSRNLTRIPKEVLLPDSALRGMPGVKGDSVKHAETKSRVWNMIYVRVKQSLGSCDRASWAKYEERKTNKMQQLDVH